VDFRLLIQSEISDLKSPMRQRSKTLFQRANLALPGGVNSPVRAFKAVGGEPPFIKRGHGARIWDEDGDEYLDFVGSWGPLILGHAHPRVVEAIAEAARDGASFGAPTAREVELAELICEAFPSIELVRFVNSGTEATMSAVRLARAFTGRRKILKFDGCYHGHADGLLVRAGSGPLTLGSPDSPGVLSETAAHTLSVAFNDLASVQAAFDTFSDDIAAILVEPVPGNMGVIPPAEGFLAGLRVLADNYSALLLFDEVITGFRVAYGGAQERYRVQADLTCLGKIIGGGLPVGAYGGRREIMQWVAPLGPVYQAGTLSGNPLAMAAGLATLRELRETRPYDQLERLAARLEAGLAGAAQRAGLQTSTGRVASMMTLFFGRQPARAYDSAKNADTQRYAAFFHGMLERGVYLAPSQFEAAFISTAHTGRDVEMVEQAASDVMVNLAE
jgi:glutamate-1-semialdehyde 2,1-aminomutase